MTLDHLLKRIACYCERPPPTADACERAIKAERLEHVVCCRGPDNKPWLFPRVWAYVFGEEWK